MIQGYQLNRQKVKQEIDAQEWVEIDKKLPQIPKDFYTFTPKQQMIIYYRRLLYFLHNQKLQQSAFKLAAYLLVINTNNYYALMLRSQCIKQMLNKHTERQKRWAIIQQQSYFMNCLLIINPKQYQIWNYKKDLINYLIKQETSPQSQLHAQIKKKREEVKKKQDQFLFYLMTNDDEKNYHAWDYKSWLTRSFNLIQQAIQQTQQMIFRSHQSQESPGMNIQSLWKDCYSCWSYRFNLIVDLPQTKRIQYIQQDAQKVHDFVLKNPYSQCAWNYLTGILQRKEIALQKITQIYQQIYKVCKLTKTANRFAWTFLLSIANKQIKQQALLKLIQIDPIRKLYYQYLKQNVKLD